MRIPFTKFFFFLGTALLMYIALLVCVIYKHYRACYQKL